MPKHEQLLDIVERDIRDGLGRIFTPQGAIRVQAAFSDTKLPEDDVSFVPWEYDALHDQPLHTVAGDGQDHIASQSDDPPVVGATNASFTITGVTVVDARRPAVRLYRFLDWANVFANVGLHVSVRPGV